MTDHICLIPPGPLENPRVAWPPSKREIVVLWHSKTCFFCPKMFQVMRNMRIPFVAVDIDGKYCGAAKSSKLRGVPCLQVYRNGRLIRSHIGFLPREKCQEFLRTCGVRGC